MNQVVWLASYPKSGNTWLRAFLTNLLQDTGQASDINELEGRFIASSRVLIDDVLGVEASDLTPREIERYRPDVYRKVARSSEKMLFIKIHDAYGFTGTGEPLIPADVTRGAIYILRNPLDVAVSFACYSDVSVDEMIKSMGDETCAIADNPRDMEDQVAQRLTSWSRHVLSWVDLPVFPVHVLRYEDMHHKPLETCASVVRFLGLTEDNERIRRALLHSSFDILQAQERTHGFKERTLAAEPFFRKGQVGSWREALSEAQVERIVQDHSVVMQRVGYLSQTGEILC